MSYVLPQVSVFQEFTAAPQSQVNPLRAFICGGHAQLIRYAQSDERELGRLGFYDPLVDSVYDWPGRSAGAVVDQAYAKLWVKDAILKYFEDTVGGGSTITKVAASTNRVRSDSVNFKTNTATYPRAAALKDRDVQLGDVVQVRFVPLEGDPVTLWSYVNGIVGDTVAAVLDTPTTDAVNAATHAGAHAAAAQVAGPWNAVVIAAADGSTYDPYPTGQVSETYTVIVTASSAGNDLTTARLRVISASGLDDQDEVTPAAEGEWTDIGTHGLKVQFDDSGGADASASAETQGVSPNDLIAGQRWTVTVSANFTATAAPTAAGTYTGATDTTYVVEVVSGNAFATAAPQIQVSTTTGVDISGPTAVSAAGVAVPVGTQGVTLSFAGNGLALGDRFYVTATAAKEGPMRTIVLGHNIPSTVSDGTECDLTLYIRKPNLQITQNRIGYAPLVNFATSATQLTVKSGIVAYDETWTDGGVPLALPLEASEAQGYGLLYAEYRAWLPTLAGTVNTISDVGELDAQIAGALDPDNPLKYGVYKALANANGTEVKYAAVTDPADLDAWTNLLESLLGRDDVYGLAPLSSDPAVHALFAAHCADQSAPTQGLWRVLWAGLSGVPAVPVVSAGSSVAGHTAATTSDGTVCLAVIEDDPASAGSQYTIVRVPAGNARFIANGVRAGDVVRALYTGDGFGGSTYQEFIVDAVQTEDQLRLVAGPTAPVAVAAKIEVWRNLTAAEEAAEIVRQAGAFGTRRVRAVWPDLIDAAGSTVPGYFACAALAGEASGILPHQPMTNLELAGFTAVPRTTVKFNRPQLDAMAEGGVWIVTQANDGTIYTRHALTTGDYNDLNQREEMICRNVDSISYRFKDQFAPYIGVANVTPAMVELLRLEVVTLVEVLKNEKYTRTLGGQMIDATITELRPHALLKDKIVLRLNVTVPAPFNNMDCVLII